MTMMMMMTMAIFPLYTPYLQYSYKDHYDDDDDFEFEGDGNINL